MRPKADQPSDRKNQILAAAADLFAEQGYYKTTTADVARAVGVTQPYIFHFFKSKEELYLAVLSNACRLIQHAFQTVEAEDPALLPEAMGAAFNELMNQHRNAILLVMMSFATPDTSIRGFTREGFDAIFETVRGRFKQAGIPQHDYAAATFIGQGLLIAMAEVLQLPKLVSCLNGEHEM